MDNFFKFVLYSIVSAVIFIFIYSFMLGMPMPGEKSLQIQVSSIVSRSISLEDFNRNPQDYIGKNISVTGDYHFFGGRSIDGCKLHTLEDNKGFQIDFCPSIKRSWDNGKVYTIKGDIRIINVDNFWDGQINKYILFEE